MGLFSSSKEEKNKLESLPPVVSEKKHVKNDKDPIESILAKEMHIVGEISFQGKARFDGTIEGNIKGEYLILSKTANVKGNIDVETLICEGIVDGNITAEIVTVHATAAIHGILKSENLTVESGAALDGEIHASSRKQASVPLIREGNTANILLDAHAKKK